MPGLKEKMVELDGLLAKQLSDYGFKRKRKHKFVRRYGDCLQHITIPETKVRGVSQVHLIVCIGFQYEKVDKVICFIKNKKYEAKWGTASINIDTLMDSKVPYRFYVDESTELEPIVLDIFHKVQKYALNFLNSCDNLDKFEKMLSERDKNVRRSTFGLNRPEWNLVALAILLGHRSVEEIFEEYEEDFKKNLPLLQVAKERIKQYDVRKEVDV